AVIGLLSAASGGHLTGFLPLDSQRNDAVDVSFGTVGGGLRLIGDDLVDVVDITCGPLLVGLGAFALDQVQGGTLVAQCFVDDHALVFRVVRPIGLQVPE